MGTCIAFSPSSSSFFPSHLKLDDNNENGGQGMILIERTHLITISPHYSEAVLSRGYSPLLLFDVPDVDNTVVKLLRMGASLDGPIQYPDHGKVLFDSKLLITESCFPLHYIIHDMSKDSVLSRAKIFLSAEPVLFHNCNFSYVVRSLLSAARTVTCWDYLSLLIGLIRLGDDDRFFTKLFAPSL